MLFNDLRDFDDNSQIEADLCIVGSGPAGLSIAKEFVNTKIKVWVIESGGLEEELATQALCKIESVGAPRTGPQDTKRTRIFGGSSHIWTGRCAPFHSDDFEKRSWVPYSGWPIKIQDVEPYLEKAGQNLGLGPNCYDSEKIWELFGVKKPAFITDLKSLESTLWQFSRNWDDPRVPRRFGQKFLPDNANNISVLLHANVTHINTNAIGSHVESLEISTLEHKRAHVKARAFILCCGGIENARLLLASNRNIKDGVGNQHGIVGRFLMDHPNSKIGTFDKDKAKAFRSCFGHYWLDTKKGRHVYLHGLTMSSELQAQEKLLRCDAFIEEFNQTEDNIWLVLQQLKVALRQKYLTKQEYQKILSVLVNSPEILRGLYRRYVGHRPPLTRGSRIEVHCMLEQLPNPDSRISLSDSQTDVLGMPISKINWQTSRLEFSTIQRMSQLIYAEMLKIGLPCPRMDDWLEQEESWTHNFIDKAHPTGATRMSVDAKSGVVDPNCQVHGMDNLFVAGSSVFPTSGTANPTLMIIALAVRLSEWLKCNYFKI